MVLLRTQQASVTVTAMAIFAEFLWAPCNSTVLLRESHFHSDSKNCCHSIGFCTYLIAAIFRVSEKIAVANVVVCCERVLNESCKTFSVNPTDL